MHRNTYILLVVLAVVAALVVGVNVGRRTQTQLVQEPTPTVTQSIQLTQYTSTACGVSFSYPNTLVQLDSATKSAIFAGNEGNAQAIILTCQSEIPRPAIPQEQTESMTIGTVSATLYHDTSAKDGRTIDILIFTHPATQEDVLLSGFGTSFEGVIQSLKLLP
jgi:hypothetical protein